MSNTVLMVVDVQNRLINEHPYNEKKVVGNIKKLIEAARNNEKEVIYVRHDDGEGTELEKGTYGWQIYGEISPNSNEKIFDKKFNSAFIKTGLKEYLESKNIDTIILTGLQTEYCIDATCKSAFEHEYKIIIPEETNTTFDNEYLSEFYNYKIWSNRFARVLSMNEVTEMLIK